MSGGVDSSVAAHLLIQQRFQIVGVFMRHGTERSSSCNTPTPTSTKLPIIAQQTHRQGCCSATDAEDARRVADTLDIPFYALDLQEDFDRIIQYFVDQYTHGRTPNPCVMCNNWLKFGKLFEYADSVGAEFVATGHYARLRKNDDGSESLLRGVDEDKDQSYLHRVVVERNLQLARLDLGQIQHVVDLVQQVAAVVVDTPDDLANLLGHVAVDAVLASTSSIRSSLSPGPKSPRSAI